MVITQIIPPERLLERLINDLCDAEPAGNPKQTTEAVKARNDEYRDYRQQREMQIIREHMRKNGRKGGALS